MELNSNIVGGVVVMLIGLGGILKNLLSISRAIDSEDWMRIDCEILESKVKEVKGEGSEYYPEIKYKYTVNGIEYFGNTVRIGGTSVFRLSATDICKKYHKGRVLKVNVDPNNHLYKSRHHLTVNC